MVHNSCLFDGPHRLVLRRAEILQRFLIPSLHEHLATFISVEVGSGSNVDLDIPAAVDAESLSLLRGRTIRKHANTALIFRGVVTGRGSGLDEVTVDYDSTVQSDSQVNRLVG